MKQRWIIMGMGLLLVAGGMKAQERGDWQWSVSGGVASPAGKLADAGFPLGLARPGGLVSLGVDYVAGDRWGIGSQLVTGVLGYDAGAGARSLLEGRPDALAVTVHAEGYFLQMMELGAWIEPRLTPRWQLRLRASAGGSLLHTPGVTAHLETAPYEELRYRSGRTGALLGGLSLSPSFALSRHAALYLALGGYWSPLSVQIEDDVPGRQRLDYVLLTGQLGLRYRFSQVAAARQ